MKKVWVVFFLLLFIYSGISANAQGDPSSSSTSTSPRQGPYRVSLITCSPGEDIWETFGHACVRVIDSSKRDAERDKVYNYGFYEASEDNTLLSQALSGRVIDFLDTITYDELMIEYTAKRRMVEEQVLLLNDEQKEKVVSFLKNNLKRENRYYEFDTYLDNCTTRIRDLFVSLFSNRYKPGSAVPVDSRLTFRDVSLNSACPAQYKYWFGLALNLSYGRRADRVMSNNDAMFSPALFSNSMTTATLDGKPLCGEKTVIIPNGIEWQSAPNIPFILLLLLSVCTVGAALYERTRMIGMALSYLLLLLSGALGCCLIYLWHLDGEPAWKDNLNVLWALPTNIVVPFLPARAKAGYSLLAIGLIGLSLLLHIFQVQIIPLFEVAALLFALIFIFAIMYRSYRVKKVIHR